MSEKIILGIDPGTNIMGYGLLQIFKGKPDLLHLGILRLKRGVTHFQRLQVIFEKVVSLINEFSPSELAIESPFYGKNIQSTLKLGRAQGVAIMAALSCGLPIYEYAPLQVKLSVTGNGRASKKQVADMLKRLLVLSSEEICFPTDATDALAVALCRFFHTNSMISSKQRDNWTSFLHLHPEKIRSCR